MAKIVRVSKPYELPNLLTPSEQLRKLGYRIYARPNTGPAIWFKDGRLYRQVDESSILLEQEKRTAACAWSSGVWAT